MRDTKNQIVAAIKNLGYNTRQVSVRQRHIGSFRVTVRDPQVNMEAVEQAVEQYENIYRDEATGEILSGGNTFIFVEATEEVKAAWAAQNMPEVEAAALIAVEPNRGVQINENYSLIPVWGDYYQLYYSNPQRNIGQRVGYERMSTRQVAIEMYLNDLRNR